MDMQVAIDKLHSLESELEVKDFLESQKVRGFCGQAERCALAMWLSRETEHQVEVGDVIRDYSDMQPGEEHGMFCREYPLTDALTAFIQAFDGGQYPSITVPASFDTATTYHYEDHR